MARKGLQSSKRAIIDKANYLMFISVAAAAALIAVTAVTVNYLSKMITFQTEVNKQKQATLEVTENNIKNFEVVMADINDLRDNQNLIDTAKSQEYRDEPLRVVANALPAYHNLAAFGASVANLVITRVGDNEAVTQGISVGRDSTITPTLNTSAKTMNMSFQVVGALGCTGQATSCDQPVGISAILNNLERSIRLIEVNAATFVFRSPTLIELSVQGNGFYTSPKTVNMTTTQINAASVLAKKKSKSLPGTSTGGTQ
ncbi:MAG: hypothetical protein LBM12_00595 [Candidatus Nomurabacteria bacterium]|jgi:hypothetical protein|nr:hypothetical protein [Candidatus Nomurabacteria bacterium]